MLFFQFDTCKNYPSSSTTEKHDKDGENEYQNDETPLTPKTSNQIGISISDNFGGNLQNENNFFSWTEMFIFLE